MTRNEIDDGITAAWKILDDTNSSDSVKLAAMINLLNLQTRT